MIRLRGAAGILWIAALGGCASHPDAASFSDQASLRAAHEALSQGAAATSLAIARGVLSLKPADPGALVSVADAEAALGDRAAARQDYARALAAAPGFGAARLGLARLAMADNPATAEADLRTLLRDEPRNAAALTDLGVALDLQDRHAAAQASYDRALALDPNLASARLDLAVSLALGGEAARAETLLRDAEGSVPEPRLRADLALAETLAGDANGAERTLAYDLPEREAQSSVAAMAALLR